MRGGKRLHHRRQAVTWQVGALMQYRLQGGDYGVDTILGDALRTMETMAAGTYDAIVTDPPYASGGMKAGDRRRSTGSKYIDNPKTASTYDFAGDASDQRSWTRRMTIVLQEALRVCKDGGAICVFCDWRQYPALSDALQGAGWAWRGAVVWDKQNPRPQKGRFKQQAEFVLWGSKGEMPVDRPVPCLPGVYRHSVIGANNRYHQTQKPLDLMRELVRIVVPGGRILDPFSGSGTTLEAARLEGYDADGIEIVPEIYQIARQRLGLT